jgi:hypothetical protein
MAQGYPSRRTGYRAWLPEPANRLETAPPFPISNAKKTCEGNMKLFRLLAATGLAALAWGSAAAQSDLYTLCAFYPQGTPCEGVYRQSLTDTAPPAQAVQQAWLGYARYLKNAAPGLTDQDREFLRQNAIQLPADLSAADLGGLHNVIADPGLKTADDKRQAVNNFINRALEAEIYCGFHNCKAVRPGKPSGA